eukprot:68705-Pleurochrysis_carterae.AAC.2
MASLEKLTLSEKAPRQSLLQAKQDTLRCTLQGMDCPSRELSAATQQPAASFSHLARLPPPCCAALAQDKTVLCRAVYVRWQRRWAGRQNGMCIPLKAHMHDCVNFRLQFPGLLHENNQHIHITWDIGDGRWVNTLEVQNMNGAEADTIRKARELIMESTVTFVEHMKDDGVGLSRQTWDYSWSEFLRRYAQQGDRGETAKENTTINEERADTRVSETHPTLCPLEVVGDDEASKET